MKIQFSLKSDKNNGHFYVKTKLAQFLLEWEIFETKVLGKLKPHFKLNNFFYFENSTFCEILWGGGKYCIAGQATDDNMAHERCLLGTLGYKHRLRICDTYWFFHWKNGCTKVPQCYVIRPLPVLLWFEMYVTFRFTSHFHYTAGCCDTQNTPFSSRSKVRLIWTTTCTFVPRMALPILRPVIMSNFQYPTTSNGFSLLHTHTTHM